ncbi:MAG TPA: site-2 protease family protein [Gammaproteobacteria bacterium]|jgi:Zn-dependent protease|nr:site-2 protease family protein [Gammaproteobacteria bacterium]
MTIAQKIAIWALPLIFAITLHEVAHGWVASWFGDKTAKLSGRLSLNPLHHIDPIGTVAVPLLMLMVSNFIFGWAKPVPVDARNMRHPRWGMAVVSLAGPVSNLLMAFFWGFMAWVGESTVASGNAWLGVPLSYMGGAGIMINVVLAVLNLLPLPPLDGGAFLESVLPPRMAYHLSLIAPYSFFILILLIVTGMLSFIMMPPVNFLMNLVTQVFGLSL